MKRSFHFIIILTMMFTVSFSTGTNAQLAAKKIITLEFAKKIAAAAETEAVKNNWTVVISILDDGGNLIYLEKMDNTQIGSIDVSLKKAETAVKFKRPSKAFEDMVNGGKYNLINLTGALPVEGGLPLMIDGQPAGAIGVSGAKSNQDGIVAKAGEDFFNSHLK